MADETGTVTPRRSNVFTNRIGPLPMWQWLLIALAMVAVYVIFEYRKKNKGGSAAGAPTGGTTDAAQVPQFVNQTYTTVVPPSPPPMPPGVPGPRPAGPAGGPVPVPAIRPAQMPPASGGPTFGGNTLVNQAVSQLQSQGYNVTGVMREGIAGFRQASPLSPSQYGQAYVAGVTYSGKNATVYAG